MLAVGVAGGRQWILTGDAMQCIKLALSGLSPRCARAPVVGHHFPAENKTCILRLPSDQSDKGPVPPRPSHRLGARNSMTVGSTLLLSTNV